MEENKDWRDILPERIQEAIERKKDEDFKYNQKTLCQNIGISEATLSLLLKGERNPRIDTIIAISDELNVDVDFLIGKTNHERRPKSKEEIKIEELCDMFGMNKNSINTLLTTFFNGKNDNGLEIQATLDAIYGKTYWYNQLIWKLRNYFNYDASKEIGSHIVPNTALKEVTKEVWPKEALKYGVAPNSPIMRLEVEGEINEFYDNVNGKGYLTPEQYEELLLKDVTKTLEIMKKYSAFGLSHLHEHINFLKAYINNSDKINEQEEDPKYKEFYEMCGVPHFRENTLNLLEKELTNKREELRRCEQELKDRLNYNKNQNWPED